MVEPKYIIDSDGNKTDVLLPYDDFIELMEDLEDYKSLADRKDEDTVDHEEVEKLFS